jgi:lipopolysaccharide biosynthesis protein
MMTFQDLGMGSAVYVDPLAIRAVIPAMAAPDPAIAAGQRIPRTLGSQIIIAGVGPLVVKGMPADIASRVTSAQEMARAAVTIN